MVKLDAILDEHGEMSHDDYRKWLDARGIVTMPGPTAFMRYIERLEAQAKPITWTTEKPSQPGWYWWRDQSYKANKPFVCKIVKYCGELVAVFAEMNEDDLNDHVTVLHSLEGGEWSSSPIPES